MSLLILNHLLLNHLQLEANFLLSIDAQRTDRNWLFILINKRELKCIISFPLLSSPLVAAYFAVKENYKVNF